MKDYKEHELSKIIPAMSDEEFQKLKWNIEENGFDEEKPIFIFENKILDGRHRYQVCKELKIEPKFKEYSGKTPLLFVITANVHRRHLTSSQIAVIAVENLPKLEEEAKWRQREGAIIGGKISGKGRKKDSLSEKIPQGYYNEGKSAEHAARIFGGNAHYISDAKRIKEESPDAFEDMRTGKITISEAKRAIKKEKREEDRNEDRKTLKNIPDIREALGKVKFPTITIDPPWDWGDEGDDDQLGRARPDYATMSFDEILKFPVSDFADKDCHIYLWITNRSLPKGFALLEAWGFRYITCITWCKPSFGMGNYFRGATEHILFGVKGSQELKRKNATTWFQAKRGKGGHSSKPEEFYTLVESCSPGPYLEIFARQQKDKRNDWTCWGNE